MRLKSDVLLTASIFLVDIPLIRWYVLEESSGLELNLFGEVQKKQVMAEDYSPD